MIMEAHSLHRMVRESALRRSANPAVVFDSGGGASPASCLTFQQLRGLSDELTARLNLQVGPSQQLIGLFCHPHLLLPAWICGILQVPAAYVPLDPGSPPPLTMRVMNRCHLKFCLIQSDLLQRFQASLSTLLFIEVCSVWETLRLTLVKIKPETNKAEENPASRPEHEPTSLPPKSERETEQLAYVLHTSGTTGLPKIVRVPHKCIVPNILHLRSLFQVTSDDVVFLASPLTFDPSVVEMFLALCSGARLLIVPTAVKRMPSRLARVLFTRNATTILQATPTLLRRFGRRLLQDQVLSAGSSLRVLALGGEPCPSLSLLQSWRQTGNRTRVFNLYGSTEVSCWACCYEVPERDLASATIASGSVPLGEPLMDTVVEVRDMEGRVLTNGEGQVFIGGENRVCLLDEEATIGTGVMRPTGDWVMVQNSHLHYLGRRDRLIKRHGQRVHLDALQQTMESLPQVDAAVVGLHEGGRLVAFMVPAVDRKTANGSLEPEVLRELSQLVSSHSLPDSIVPVPALPLTNHGKVAMEKLMRLYERQREVSGKRSSLGDMETARERLQTLWREYLGLSDDCIVADDARFMLSGGDSLQALRLLDHLALTVGSPSAGLLEVILDGTFSDILTHITTPPRGLNQTPAKRPREESPPVTHKRSSKDADSKQPSCPEVSQEQRTMGFVVASRAGRVVEWDSKGTLVLRNNKEKESNSSSECEVKQSGSSADGSDVNTDAASDSDGLLLQTRWSSDTGRCVDASPVLLQGSGGATVFIGSHSNRFQALDLITGDVMWERVLGDRLESSAAVTKCGTMVAVGCYDGRVYFLRVNSGETHWAFETGDAVKSSPTVDPQTGLVIIGSHDGHVYALEPLVKNCLWKRHCGGGAVFSSPCVHSSPRRLYCATLGGQLHCLHPDSGRLLWTYSCDVPLFSSPSCSDSCVYIGLVSGCIRAVKHDGSKLWDFVTDGPVFSSPCVASLRPAISQKSTRVPDAVTSSSTANEVVICGSHDCSVYGLNPTNGSLLWRFQTAGKVYASPFAFDGTRWGLRTLVAVASTNGTVWIVDGERGTVKASLTLPGELFSSPVVWGRSILIGCRNDYVYHLELSSGTAEATNVDQVLRR